MASRTQPSQAIDTPYDLSTDQIAQFRHDGFIKLKNVLDAEIIEYYARSIAEQTVARDSLKDVPLEDRNTYDQAFIQVGNLWEKCETVKELTFSKRIAKIAADLLEVSGVRLWHDQALFKVPGGGFTPWHVDQQYWPMLTDRSVTAWIPLQAVPLNMGPLQFGCESHRMNVGRQLEISDSSEKVIENAVEKYHIETVHEPYELGEVSFHLGWTLHRAGGNTTPTPRAVHTMIYMEENQRLIEPQSEYHKADWKAWTPSTKIGEVMADPKNPVLYSRKG